MIEKDVMRGDFLLHKHHIDRDTRQGEHVKIM